MPLFSMSATPTQRLSWGLSVAVLSLAVSSAQAGYSKVVVFSDSMSDTHRYYELTEIFFGKGKGRPKSPPSMRGRFCDGKVAVEILAEQVGAPLQGYSFSGAQSGYQTLVPGVPWGVLTQVNEYLNNNAVVPTISTLPVLGPVMSALPGAGKADPKALHVIWTGPDDFYALGGFSDKTGPRAAANIQQAITTLYNAGARYFFVPTMPDLAVTPSARRHERDTPGYIAKAAMYSERFSVQLQKALAASRAKYPKAAIMGFDTIPFMKAGFAKAAAEGKNVTDACFEAQFNPLTPEPDTACPDPENYVFWDSNHPTAYANKVLGEAWAKAITVQP